MRAGYVRLKTHTQNMKNLLLFHCNNGCKNAPQCYVIRALTVLLSSHVTVRTEGHHKKYKEFLQSCHLLFSSLGTISYSDIPDADKESHET